MGSGLQAGVDRGRNAHLSPGARLQGQHTSISPGAWAAELTLLLLHDVIMANRLLAAWQRQKKIKIWELYWEADNNQAREANCRGSTVQPERSNAGAARPLSPPRRGFSWSAGARQHKQHQQHPQAACSSWFSLPVPEAKQLLPQPGARRLLRARPGGHCLPRGAPKGQLLLRSWAGEDDALSRRFPQPPQLCRIIISLAP